MRKTGATLNQEAEDERTAQHRLRPMTALEFKYGLLRLADGDETRFISESTIARRLAAAYTDADEATQADCSEMLRADLEKLP